MRDLFGDLSVRLAPSLTPSELETSAPRSPRDGDLPGMDATPCMMLASSAPPPADTLFTETPVAASLAVSGE